ncbi:hypothetical protein N657DRAFT_640485 [Parathielavia appendiculata]|uniref:Uncharacterized protein n=1 Tax=Parathielavia appendiculata TaxID=2587402 RepID=A0AAN6Z9A2_9PEZI|nr:hypothetical protein N657DRAFT_640485 [Parathielavia appendiculata]
MKLECYNAKTDEHNAACKVLGAVTGGRNWPLRNTLKRGTVVRTVQSNQKLRT